jgi:DMSO/TMAO reductase YedYZ molybdopterin-dependent catalytic subunit
MARGGISRAGTGLAAGALLTAPLLGVLALGWLAGLPFVPYSVFEWLIRVLPGPVVTFGLDLTLAVLNGLGLDVKQTAKTSEQVLAVATLFVAGLVVGLLFFLLVRTAKARRVQLYGLGVGGAVGAFSLAVSLTQGHPAGAAGKAGFSVWVLILFLLWGWGMARLFLLAFPAPATETAPASEALLAGAAPPAGEAVATGETLTAAEAAAAAPARVSGPRDPEPSSGSFPSLQAEARAISRRRFIIQMGGVAATVIVVGAGVGEVLRAETRLSTSGEAGTPITYPNADSPVQPAPGTRQEYTPVADHYQVDIDLAAPDISEAEWRLVVDGLVAKPLTLTLGRLKSAYDQVDQFVTLACISNPLGGPFIGTTLWSGASLRDVLAEAGPRSDARFIHIESADEFGEEIDLELARSDSRIMLTYAWDGQPLTRKHGFPLRVLVPDRYGMKQPKWITRLTLAAESKPGYWVERGWDETAEVKTVSVIDTVAVKSLVTRDGQTYVPIGGIAHAGAKGISKVEVQVDDGPWQAAQLREPLSGLTWVIWRFDWPFDPGTHQLSVRAYDGQGRLQVTEEAPASPSAATGVYTEQRTIPAVPPPQTPLQTPSQS